MAERLTIDELIEHCNRQLDRFPSNNPLYCEHEAIRHYLQRLRHYIKTNLTPEEIVQMNDFMNTQCAKLLEENGRLKAERDAVVADIPHSCKTCLYAFDMHGNHCENCDNEDNWQWRGVKEETK